MGVVGLSGYYLGFGRGRKIPWETLSILLAPRSNSGVTPVGLPERYKGTSSPPFIAPPVASKPIEHPRTTAGHLGSHRICLSVFVPLTAILQGSVKKRILGGAFAVLETRV